MEIEAGNWKIILSQKFLRDNSNLTKTQIEKGIIEGPWFLPTLNSNHWLSGMGTTGHRAMPCGCCINGQTIDIFAKPHDNFYLALTEFDNSEIARLRGVNVPPVLAVIDMGDEAMLISIGDGLFATDIEGKIVLINTAFKKMLGKTLKLNVL